MQDRYLFRGKRKTNVEWVDGAYYEEPYTDRCYIIRWNSFGLGFNEFIEVDPSTICQCTGIKDKNGKLIFENDILMCHGNPNDLVKVVFGKFTVINAETLENIDEVIGWHYEVIPTDAISRCEPFCLSMPITEDYVKTCEFEVIGNMIDNPELLEV